MPRERGLETEIRAGRTRPSAPRWLKFTLGVIALGFIVLLAIVGHYYKRFASEIDSRIHAGIFADTSNIYGPSVSFNTGDTYSPGELNELLGSQGYRVQVRANEISAELRRGAAERRPQQLTILLDKSGRITRLALNGAPREDIRLAPALLVNISAPHDKRRIVTYDQIPPVLVRAILAAEDKRFFLHDGVDFARLIKATYVDFRTHRKEQGASTLTMQLVRSIWLRPRKTWKRKVEEILMTMHLEHTWSKPEIFAQYANQVFLGRQGSYNVHGFAEAARVFFGKSIGDLTVAESALLAGMVQRPSDFNPVRSPEVARDRRNLVLGMMREDELISPEQYRSAVAAPLGVHAGESESSGSSYYLDLVSSELENPDHEDEVRNVYITVDPRLQRAAAEAIRNGMQGVDKLLARRYAKGGARAEAALIALDPHTGEIKALVGGRDYAKSQLDRVLANRPPGSAFKPVVYAAAIANGMTAATMVDDSGASFSWNGAVYEPKNFKNETFGNQMLIDAMAHSDNIAAVKVARKVGLNRVVQMAQSLGLNDGIKATPAVALGSYAVTPLEIAGAYTAFANGGLRMRPRLISEIRDADGKPVADTGPESRQAIDPKVAAVMVSMLEQVIRSGTAAGVRGMGFKLPAAGKTGTSHDGWFAGFTTHLLCIVWVGFDDYSDLDLEGARSALPIWAAFMKRAANYSPWRDASEFPDLQLLESAKICAADAAPADADCANPRTLYFIPGTVPHKAPPPPASDEEDQNVSTPGEPAPEPAFDQ